MFFYLTYLHVKEETKNKISIHYSFMGGGEGK
jgi:hypothetical protein